MANGNLKEPSGSLVVREDHCGGDLGHAQAISKLFDDHNRALHAFLMMQVGDEHEAREVAQEAYVRVLQLDQPGTVSFLQAYLFKTARNIAIDRARQRLSRGRLDRMDAAAGSVDTVTPEQWFMGKEDLAVFQRALFELPEHYRRAFTLHRFEEWSHENIARDLGVQARTVRYYIAKAIIYCKLRVQGRSAHQAQRELGL
jgi:RNA polymerase sigma factor (sigma-70 family)